MPPDNAKAPAWLPNWRDASLYSSNLSDVEWRWQFLRRHPEYQALWERPCDASFVHSLAISGNHEITTRDQDRLAEFKERYPSAQILRALYIDEAAHFGVRCILDPGRGDIPSAITRGFWTTAVELESWEFSAMFAHAAPPSAAQWKRWNQARRAGLRAFVLDLRFDIDEQFKARRPWLKFAQRDFRAPPEPSPVAYQQLWSTYLRVLDGRTAGATWAAISRELRLLSDVQVKKGIKHGPKARQTWDQARAVLFRFGAAS